MHFSDSFVEQISLLINLWEISRTHAVTIAQMASLALSIRLANSYIASGFPDERSGFSKQNIYKEILLIGLYIGIAVDGAHGKVHCLVVWHSLIIYAWL
jgi:hypothetical protein